MGVRRGTWSRPSEPVLTRAKVTKDIVYSKEDDQAIDDWIADRVYNLAPPPSLTHLSLRRR